MKKLVLLFLFLIVIFNSKSSFAQHSDTLNPVADVYIVTFGGGEGKNSFLKFDISSIPVGNVITEVIFKAFVTDVSASWDGDVFYSRVDKQTWLESDPNDTLWNPLNFTDSLIQAAGFGPILGWTESIDLKSLLIYDYSLSNSFFTLMIKDIDDMTMVPGPVPLVDSNDSMMIGNIFNDFIVYAPHENIAFQPQLIVKYTLIPKLTSQSDDSVRCEMDDVSFYVSAVGDSVEYQWQKDGIDMPTETDSTLSLLALGLSDAAVYRCILSNAVASDTSNNITLTINALPIVFLGLDTAICADASILLDAGAGFDSYLWSDFSTGQNLLLDSNSYGLGLVSVFVEVTDNNCTTIDTIDVTFEICSGIESIENIIVDIFPNPAQDIIIIHSSSEINKYYLSDMSGRIILAKQINAAKEFSVNLNGIASGIYQVVLNGENSSVRKLIVKE